MSSSIIELLTIILFLLLAVFRKSIVPQVAGLVLVEFAEDNIKDVGIPFSWVAFNTFLDILQGNRQL